jgi:hypothetical protein
MDTSGEQCLDPDHISVDVPRLAEVERAMGIEPTAQAWEAWVLPLYDARAAPIVFASPTPVQIRPPARTRPERVLDMSARRPTGPSRRLPANPLNSWNYRNLSSICRSSATAWRLVSFASPMMATSSACCSGVIPLLRAAAPCEAMQYRQALVTLTAM